MLDSGFAFSSPEDDVAAEQQHVNHDIASLKVRQFHREEQIRSDKFRSFESLHTTSRTGSVPGFDRTNAVLVSDLADTQADSTVTVIKQL